MLSGIKNEIKGLNSNKATTHKILMLFVSNTMLSGIKNEIKGLNSSKTTTHNNIPPKTVRQSAEVTVNTLQLLFKESNIKNSEFP